MFPTLSSQIGMLTWIESCSIIWDRWSPRAGQSNRCFPSKAISMWFNQGDHEHCLVIAAYFHYSRGWTKAKLLDISPQGARTQDPLFIVEAVKGSSEPPKLDASRWLKKR